ncbi:MAG: hypothetical protein KKE11_05170 [Gammaproteobacteria bacterium]|nr:hypothetical protein [Gammaproteobacteria bacterium]
MGNILTILGGIVAILLGVTGLMNWWELFLKGLKATIPAMLIFAGLIALMAGISELKDAMEAKKEEKKEKEESEKKA